MNTITIDFETRSKADLTEIGGHKYAADPSTEILCMAYCTEPGNVKLWSPGLTNFPARVFENRTIHAHNASFERNILRDVLDIDLPASRFRCSAAQSIQSGLARGLDKACSALKIDDGKDVEGHVLMKKLVKPNKKGLFEGTDEEMERLYAYCRQDVQAEMNLEALLPPVQPFMQEAWEAHEAMNHRGIPIDADLVRGAAKIMQEAIGEASNTVFEITEGRIKTGGQREKILDYVNERGVNIGDLQAATVNATLERDDLDPNAREVLLLRRAVSGVAAKKHNAILDYLMPDNRIRDSYVFPGAHTGRAASWGVQVMNFKKMAGSGFPTIDGGKAVQPEFIEAVRSGKLSELERLGRLGLNYNSFDPMTMLGYAVRAAVCAPDGKVFIFRDLSQIEVRLAHWYCLNNEIMELFKARGDIYKDFASKLFKIPISEVSKDQRQLAKPIVLGSNYGMGAERLAAYAKTFGITLSTEQAQTYVTAFRKLYHRIPKLWKALETAAIQCTLDGKRRKIGILFAGVEGKFFYFELPSGRRVYYLNPEVKRNKKGPGFVFEFQSHHGYREHTWGGTLLENLCQAGTADLTNLTIARAEKAGLCPIINQHDEIGIEVDAKHAEEAGAEFGRLIEQGADWTVNLPVGSDMAVQQRWIK